MDRTTQQRLRVVIRGAVQGVGFRPFVYRLATEMGLPGWVNNSSQGVFIEVDGSQPQLDAFLLRLEREKPPHAFIQSLESSILDPLGFTSFEIRHSEESGAKSVLVMPDLATCPDCLHDISDPANRRYRYPFTNCTNCGPRFSIIEALPYDRPNTSMKAFPMCADCRAEYENPLDRRFHAQPNACPVCGPHLELWDHAGRIISTHNEALLQAADAIRRGQIVAAKGIGGFHLMVDARNDDAVQRLRARKHREEKPFALMAPTLEQIRAICEVSELEERLLLSPEAPIVLLERRRIEEEEKRRKGEEVTDSSSPRLLFTSSPLPSLGFMLPYTPLHHLLMAELGFPVVATSGNLSDEPICIDEHEAIARLGEIADIFLVHNRPIVRHVDDSIVRVVLGREMVLRRARGYAPLPVRLPYGRGEATNTPGVSETPGVFNVLAVGAHLKNNVAIIVGENVFISQHIGDLETPQAYDAFRRVIHDLSALYEFQPIAIACDLHPDYMSTHFAREYAAIKQLPVIAVQHHFAHVAACMAENDLLGEQVLGVSWDGTGYGGDGAIWGGEFLVPEGASFTRVAHLRLFHLPGGDAAIREPRRIAFGLLYELFGDDLPNRTDLAPVAALTPSERNVLRQMVRNGLNAPQTSSTGRLFDAVAALMGLPRALSRLNYEGQAAMELEFSATADTSASYPFLLAERFEVGDWRLPREQSPIPTLQSPLIADWAPMVDAIISDLAQGVSVAVMATKFHNTLAGVIVDVAQRVGIRCVVLTGGVFQNKLLLEKTVGRLREAGFQPYWHQRVPPNDGGIALGQAVVALATLKTLSGVPFVRSK